MKPFMLLIVMLLFFMIPAAQATIASLNESLRVCYPFDTNLTDYGSKHLLLNISPATSAQYQPGIVGSGALNFSLITALHNSTATIVTGNHNFSYAYWINYGIDATNNFYRYVLCMGAYTNNQLACDTFIGGGTTHKFSEGHYADDINNIWSMPVIHTWYFMTMTYNANTKTTSLYVNTTYIGGGAHTTNLNMQDPNYLVIGSVRPGDSNLNFVGDALMDEVMVFDKVLNSSEIAELYNSRSGLSCGVITAGAAPPSEVTVSINSPANNDHNIVPLVVNYTYDATSTNPGNCTLYVNGTANVTNINVIDSSTAKAVTNMSHGTYVYYVNCTDGITTGLSSTAYYTMDVVMPTLTWTTPASDNSSVSTSNLTFSVVAADANLYAIGYWIYFNNGTLMAFRNQTGLSATTYNLVDKVNFSQSNIYEVQVCAEDSHTLSLLPTADVSKDLTAKSLTFSYPKADISLTLASKTNPGAVTDIQYQKSTDRYSFTFTVSNTAQQQFSYDFRVRSNQPIRSVANSKYKGHLIIGDSFKQDYWLDFENDKATVTILGTGKDKDGYYADVRVISSEKTLTFNSLGGLNVFCETKKYEYHAPPRVVLTSPSNGQYVTSSPVTLSCTAADGMSLDKIFLKVFDSNNNLIDNSPANKVCYQEQANESSSCGGLDTGMYAFNSADPDWTNIGLSYDKNWNSYSSFFGSLGAISSFLYINYSKPTVAPIMAVLWQVKYGSSTIYTANYSLNNSCINTTATNIRLDWRTVQRIGGSDPAFILSCYNDSYARQVLTQFTDFYDRRYEEAVYWFYDPRPFTNYTRTNGTAFSPSYSLSLADGAYNYTCYAQTAYGLDTLEQNRTFYVDTTSSVVTAISPANNNLTNSSEARFSCNISDNIGVKNITFMLWNSTASLLNTTLTNITGNNGTLEQYYSLPSQNRYSWGCSGYDLAGRFAASENRTLVYASLSNCSEGNIVLTFYNNKENLPSNSLGMIAEVSSTYWAVENPLITGTFSTAYNNSYNVSNPENSTTWQTQTNYSLCIGTAGGQRYNHDTFFKYTTPGGYTHRYYIYNGTFSNVSQSISVYNFDSTTGVSTIRIIARLSSSYAFYPDVVTKLQRYYTSENTWRTVQEDKSDSFGQLVFHIIEQTTDYRLLFYDTKNNLLSTSATMKFLCTAGVCSDLTYMISPYSAVQHVSIIDTNIILNNDTRTVTAQYNDPYGATHSVIMQVFRQNGTGQTLISQQTSLGSSGVFTYNATGQSGTLVIKIYSDGVIKGMAVLELPTTKLYQLLSGNEGTFWAFAIILVCCTMALWSPVAAIFTTIAGLIFIMFTGMTPVITYPVLIFVAIMGVIIASLVKA